MAAQSALPVVPPGPLPLDEVVRLAGKSVEASVKSGITLAVLNFTSPSEAFSEYVIEEFTGALVMSRRFIIAERRSLELIRKEMRFQLSGDVSEESAQAIGRQLGAQAIVSGSLTNMGAAYRFRIKVINVETAAIEAQFSFTLLNDSQTAFLLTGKPDTLITAPPAPALVTPAPAPTPAPQPATGLKATIDWLAVHAKAGGNYGITLGKHEAVPPCSLSYDNEKVTITLKGAGGPWEITYNTTAPSAPLFTVRAGVTFIMEEGVTLKGLPKDSKSLVSVVGGAFTMQGGTISGNTAERGGGVYVLSGRFTKSGGGVIYGSNASGGLANKAPEGAAVFARDVGKRDTTTRASTVMDTGKRGAAGGWD